MSYVLDRVDCVAQGSNLFSDFAIENPTSVETWLDERTRSSNKEFINSRFNASRAFENSAKIARKPIGVVRSQLRFDQICQVRIYLDRRRSNTKELAR